VLPVERAGKYVLEFGSTVFEVDPQIGGRVTRFSLNGVNVVASEVQTGDSINWGSSTWPSPQVDWRPGDDWPPIARVDSEPYAAALDGNTIVLTSATSPQAGNEAKVSFTKRFSADLAAGAVDVEIVLRNDGANARSWAPWQVSRVPSNGLSFFPTGTVTVRDELPTSTGAGATWYQHPSGLPITGPDKYGGKLTADANAPWLAHVKGQVLFVQEFPAVQPAQFAPGEGEVTLYGANTLTYLELEPQGPYTLLQPGEALTWRLRWYVREVPNDVTVSAGSAELVSLVETVVAD
jgi:hypothetical protein